MIHLDFFTGIAGFALAAKWVGWKTLITCDIDKFASNVVSRHFPDVVQFADIKKLTYTKIDETLKKRFGDGWRDDDIIITGGFPCQPVSVAGDRKGTDDHRFLWPEMFRLITETKPTWVVAENVTGILSMVQPGQETLMDDIPSLFREDHYKTILKERFILDRICEDLEGAGYSVQPIVIPACAVGAPHKRERVWIIAHSDSSDARAEGVRQGGEDTVHGSKAATDTNIHDARRCGYGETKCEARESQGEQEEREWLRPIFERVSSKRTTSDTEITGFKTCATGQGKVESRRGDCGTWETNYWKQFPTVSPIYVRDDGLSDRLVRYIRDSSDGTLTEKEIDKIASDTIKRVRIQGIITAGNAIVPQIALEIFKVIENQYETK